MRLNLGCGRAVFPTTEGSPYTKHLAFLPDTALDPDIRWANVDRLPLPEVNEVIDLFTYPWVRSSNGNPFNDSTVDEIWASHIVEHIPHAARYAHGATAIHKDQGLLDGFYAWFYEAWRILKPMGKIYITAPVAFYRGSFSDPSHTRSITPQTFGYLVPNPDAPFDYQVAARFEQYGPIRMRPCDEWIPRLESGEITVEHLTMYSRILNNIWSEMFICLQAVKAE